jgi:hypothetical protein
VAEIAGDAYKEFARSSNAEVGLIAQEWPAQDRKELVEKLRTSLTDPRTPEDRLGLYSFLLAACSPAEEAEKDSRLLLEQIRQRNDRTLAGLIHLDWDTGWKETYGILRNAKEPLLRRLAVIRTLRFQYGAQPEKSRGHALKAMEMLLQQAEIADIAIEQLRTWKIWDLTEPVLLLFGKSDYDVPITKRAIVRYALTCERSGAAEADKTKPFLAELRKKEPDLVKAVEENLEFGMF